MFQNGSIGTDLYAQIIIERNFEKCSAKVFELNSLFSLKYQLYPINSKLFLIYSVFVHCKGWRNRGEYLVFPKNFNFSSIIKVSVP